MGMSLYVTCDTSALQAALVASLSLGIIQSYGYNVQYIAQHNTGPGYLREFLSCVVSASA